MASTSAEQAIASVSHAETAPELSRQRRLEDLGLVMLVGFLPLIVSAGYLLLVPVQFNALHTNFRFLSGLAHEFATLILFVCLLRRQGRGLQSIGLSWHWTDLLKGFGLFILSLMASYFFYWRAQSAYYFWTRAHFHFRDSNAMFAGASITLLFVYGFAASWFEELLVRGYLMTELIGISCPVWLAAGVSIALQTSYHLYYGFGAAAWLSIGFAISAIYFAYSRRLMPVILSHFFWDLTATYLRWHR
jgi:CAAX protease family protein